MTALVLMYIAANVVSNYVPRLRTHYQKSVTAACSACCTARVTRGR